MAHRSCRWPSRGPQPASQLSLRGAHGSPISLPSVSSIVFSGLELPLLLFACSFLAQNSGCFPAQLQVSVSCLIKASHCAAEQRSVRKGQALGKVFPPGPGAHSPTRLRFAWTAECWRVSLGSAELSNCIPYTVTCYTVGQEVRSRLLRRKGRSPGFSPSQMLLSAVEATL